MTDLNALKLLETSRWSKAKILSHWQPIAAHVAEQSFKFKLKEINTFFRYWCSWSKISRR